MFEGVKLGELGVVKVTVLEPPPAFHGSTRHGITTADYGPFHTAYRVDPV